MKNITTFRTSPKGHSVASCGDKLVGVTPTELTLIEGGGSGYPVAITQGGVHTGACIIYPLEGRPYVLHNCEL